MSQVRKQAEALQRALMNAAREREEAVADILNLVVNFELRLHDAKVELKERADEIFARFTRDIGSAPPPLPHEHDDNAPNDVETFLRELRPQPQYQQ